LRGIVAAVCVLAAGCGDDVVLGERPAAGLALATGGYELWFGEQVETDCIGEFAARADAFADVVATDTGLHDGRIDLTVHHRDWIEMAGAAIVDSFDQPAIELMPDPAMDTGALVAAVAIERTGVDGTEALVAELELSSDGSTSDHADGVATICFAETRQETASHACRVSFAVSLDRCCRADVP
jgi:hypothetical protein